MNLKQKIINKLRLEHTQPTIADGFYKRSYSQEGEDMLLLRVVGEKTDGFYVDIGAHHPYRFSNTQHFYEKGWNGINIDALPGSMDPFKQHRKRDINIESAVGKQGKLVFYMYDEPAINTFSKELVDQRKKQGVPYKITKKKKMDIKPLSDILDENIKKDQHIDFFSVDVEGKDLEVLETNDWSRYRPDFVLVECHSIDLDLIAKEKKIIYLKKLGYTPVAKTLNTVVLKDIRGNNK